MNVPPHTALRNRRIIWGSAPRGPGAGDVSRAIPADCDRPADRRDPGNGHRCSCSDHCSGIANSPSCNGHPDADGGADGAAALDLGSSAYNASTVTYLTNCDPECCGHGNDCGDCNDGAARAADRTA